MRPLCLLALWLVTLASAPAATLTVETFTLPIAKVKDHGFDGIFLPIKQPIDPQKGMEFRPFNTEHPLRGTFAPAQIGVIRRALGDTEIKPLLADAQLSKTLLTVPTTDATTSAALAIGGTAQPDGKIETQIQSAPAVGVQKVIVSPGTTLILTYAGREPDTVAVYLLQVKG